MIERKGSATQAFIYLSTAIIIVFTLYFGFSAIAKVNSNNDMTDILTFKSEFENDIKSMEYGSVRELTYRTNFQKVCFIDTSQVHTSSSLGDISIVPKVVLDLAERAQVPGTTDVNNVIVIIDGDSFQGFDNDRIVINKDRPQSGCFDNVAGRIKFRVKGIGKKVEVDVPSTTP